MLDTKEIVCTDSAGTAIDRTSVGPDDQVLVLVFENLTDPVEGDERFLHALESLCEHLTNGTIHIPSSDTMFRRLSHDGSCNWT